MTSAPEPAPITWPSASTHVPIAELVRNQGIKPITSVDELVEPETFESDEELEDFLTDLYATRRAGLA
jgi:hypothetical protein